MKTSTLLLVGCTTLLFSCNQGSNNKQSGQDSSRPRRNALVDPAGSDDSSFVQIDSANRMIKSYLTSIDYSSNDTNIRSLTLDANALRTYLNSDSGQTATHIKIMFAHRLSYINSVGFGAPCAYSINGLTVVLAGYDAKGNYVYFPAGTAIDNCSPCPHQCLTQGSASSNWLTE